MSEKPFMQLYVSDFIGDTLHLSTEQVGAYLLLLMAMWNAGGSLPDDDAKLARIARFSVKKWRGVCTDLLSFFDREGGKISHNRLTKELQKGEGKSQKRSDAGAAGGRAKALKDKQSRVANAMREPCHLPDTIYPPKSPNEFSAWLRSLVGEEPCLIDTNHAAIESLLGKGINRQDIQDGIRAALAKPDFRARYWRSFVGWIETAAKDRLAGSPRSVEAARSPVGSSAKFVFSRDTPIAERARVWNETGSWWHGWGFDPTSEFCDVPRNLITRLKIGAAA